MGKKIDEGIKNMKAFKKVKDHLKVLARSRPEDKYLLVTGLR
jgi:magnesium-transporting ATPase (P-type)